MTLTLRAVRQKMDWHDWMRPLMSALGSFNQSHQSIAAHLNIAWGAESPTTRQVWLEMVAREIAGARRDLDEMELGVAQAVEAAGRVER